MVGILTKFMEGMEFLQILWQWLLQISWKEGDSYKVYGSGFLQSSWQEGDSYKVHDRDYYKVHGREGILIKFKAGRRFLQSPSW